MPRTKATTSVEMVTATEAAKTLGIHFTTVYRRIKKGKIFTVTLGNILYIPKSELERLMK
jgi:excisionase family DNA binding protein